MELGEHLTQHRCSLGNPFGAAYLDVFVLD